MDLFPLYNSLRIAALSTAVIFLPGVAAAYCAAKLPRTARGLCDVLLTLPLALPPTAVGVLLLLLLGPDHALGAWALEQFGAQLTMRWWSAAIAAAVVSFPLLYRASRRAFARFDEALADAGKTLGLSGSYIFWRLRVPACRRGILAGAVLSFARALGEYGALYMVAGYARGSTAVLSTELYQLWEAGDTASALQWVLIDLAASALVLLVLFLLESEKDRR